MAHYNLDKYTNDNGFGMALNIRRGDPNPLDNSSVWASLEAAQIYAKNDPIAYVGQIITVVTTTTIQDAETGEERDVRTSKVYVINNEAGDLVEVAGGDFVDIDYDAQLAFDTSEIVIGNATPVLGRAILGRLVLA